MNDILIDVRSEVSHLLKKQERADRIWENAPNKWIRNIRCNVTKGAVGELIAKRVYQKKGAKIGPRSSKENDFSFIWPEKSTYIENKLSCLNDDGTFKWRSIRVKEDYEWISFVGIWPKEVGVWLVPKEVVIAQSQGFSNGGKSHGSHIYLVVDANNLPDWFQEWKANESLVESTRRRTTQVEAGPRGSVDDNPLGDKRKVLVLDQRLL